MSAFAAVLRLARVAAGHTQASLAERAGIARDYYGSLERGEHDPTYLILCKIAEALERPLSELFYRAGELAESQEDPI